MKSIQDQREEKELAVMERRGRGLGLVLSQSESRVDSDEIRQQQAVRRDFLGGRRTRRNEAAETYAVAVELYAE